MSGPLTVDLTAEEVVSVTVGLRLLIGNIRYLMTVQTGADLENSKMHLVIAEGALRKVSP